MASCNVKPFAFRGWSYSLVSYAAGNVTSDGTHTYRYDAENRVAGVDLGTASPWYYAYDPQNRRIKKLDGAAGTWTHYVWEGGSVIAEYSQTGALQAEYVYANGRMIAKESGGRTFFLYDRFNVRATITDGNGNIQGRQTPLPFGEDMVATGTTDKHRFTSYERDGESGLDYAVNRYYGSAAGRFANVDPVFDQKRVGRIAGCRNKIGSGIEVKYLRKPQYWDSFTYSLNDPVNKVDPLGLFCFVPDSIGGIEGIDWGELLPDDLLAFLCSPPFFAPPPQIPAYNEPYRIAYKRVGPAPKGKWLYVATCQSTNCPSAKQARNFKDSGPYIQCTGIATHVWLVFGVVVVCLGLCKGVPSEGTCL